MFEYYYAWKNNEKRQTLYKRACRVVARGRMNSCLIEFENGQRELVSRNAIKRLTKRAPDAGDSARQLSFINALSFFWLDGFAVPAPAQVTQTVGRTLRLT